MPKKRGRPASSGRGGKKKPKKKKKKGGSDWYNDSFEGTGGAISDDDVDDLQDAGPAIADDQQIDGRADSDEEEDDHVVTAKETYSSLLSSLISDPSTSIAKDQRALIERVKLEQEGIEILSEDEESLSSGEESEEEMDREEDPEGVDQAGSVDDEEVDDASEAEDDASEADDDASGADDDDSEADDDASEAEDDGSDDEEADEDDETITDGPFMRHFSRPELPPKQLKQLKARAQWKHTQDAKLKMKLFTGDVEKYQATFHRFEKPSTSTPAVDSAADQGNPSDAFAAKFDVRERIAKRWIKVVKDKSKRNEYYAKYKNKIGLSSFQEYLLPEMAAYKDIVFTDRQLANAVDIREMYAVHLLNHVFRSRDLVMKHSQRLKHNAIVGKQIKHQKQQLRELNVDESMAGELDAKAKSLYEIDEEALRDQGFTRARVLVVLPLRNSVLRLVKLLIDLLPEGSQIANRARFFEEFGFDEDDLASAGATVGAKAREQAGLFDENDILSDLTVQDTVGGKGGKSASEGGPASGKKRKVLPRPSDWRANFEGNTDDCFRLGISFPNRKSMKLFSDFYQSDIIIASPLGLRLATGQDVGEDIQADDGSEADESSEESDGDEMGVESDKSSKKHGLDIDFLSSIEMLVVDQADVYQMQNWQHLVDVCAQALNKQPLKMRSDTDFSRVRNYFLEGQSAQFRQTLIFSGYADAYLKALSLGKIGLCQNVNGVLDLSRTKYDGRIYDVLSSIPQRFVRVDADSEDATLQDLTEERFAFFRDNVFPSLLGTSATHTLVVVPSYFDFVRVRNMFSRKARELESRKIDTATRFKKKQRKMAQKGKKIKRDESLLPTSHLFCCCSEYTEPPAVTKARGEFYSGKARVMLTTERFYFYFRYRLRGVHRVVFYAPPLHGHFYSEVLNLIENEESKSAKGSSLTLYTKADALPLERVVGTSHAMKMLSAGPEDTTHVYSFA